MPTTFDRVRTRRLAIPTENLLERKNLEERHGKRENRDMTDRWISGHLFDYRAAMFLPPHGAAARDSFQSGVQESFSTPSSTSSQSNQS